MTKDNKLSEHEQLKEICDKIGYKINKLYITYENIGCYYSFVRIINDKYIPIDVREIIFTQEFMEKLSEYLGANSIKEYKELGGNIVNNLDNPVQYLYNLLGLGKQ